MYNPTGSTRSVRDLGTRVYYNDHPSASLSERNQMLLSSMSEPTLSASARSQMVRSAREQRAYDRKAEAFSIHRYASALARSFCPGLTGSHASDTQDIIDRIRSHRGSPAPRGPEHQYTRDKGTSLLRQSSRPDVVGSVKRLDTVSNEMAAAIAQVAHHITRSEQLAFGVDEERDMRPDNLYLDDLE